jgi:hypothetical protein
MKIHRLALLGVLFAGPCLCCNLCALLTMEPLEVGAQAPAFTLPSVAGETVSLSDFEGQIVLLNFWSPT